MMPLSLLLALAAAASPTPRPGPLRTFGDWAAGCDNTGICTLASLAPERGDPPPVTLALIRQPGPRGGWEVAFDTVGDHAAVRPDAVTIDGRRLALSALSGPPVDRVVRAIATGGSLGVLARGRPVAFLSLAGTAAALRWVDAQQGRASTVTATVASGPRPATAVPARPAPPVIHAIRASGTAQSPTTSQVAAMRTRAGCRDVATATGDLWTPEAHALGRGATLVLLPCATGAYNLSSALFVLRGDRVEPAPVDAPVGFDATPAAGTDRLPSIVNGRWRDGELLGDAKGRGLGDCGVRQALVWDGARLRLSEQAEMRECRANPHYIVTWRTRVIRD